MRDDREFLEREKHERKKYERENRQKAEFEFQHERTARKKSVDYGMVNGDDSNKESHNRRIKEKEVTMQFIFSHSNLVDAETMQGVIYNSDRDISLALIQIHEKSLLQETLNTYH